MIENCSECPLFEFGFLSEPNTCGYFKKYINVPKKGIPIWCPKQYKKNAREQLIQLYTLEWIKKDHSRRLYELRILPYLSQISKEDIIKLTLLVYPHDPTRASQLKVALEDSTEEKIDKLWNQLLISLEKNKK